MRLNREEQLSAKGKSTRLSAQVIFDARNEIAAVKISQEVGKCIVDIISATPYPEKYSEEVESFSPMRELILYIQNVIVKTFFIFLRKL